MTGDHVQDLLLDLAYGELPAERAAEVEAHLSTCEVCRAERDDIVRTRALVAPLRSLEEPRPGFDERIVKTARAEAGLQADGTPGPTIEVSGSVKPLGLQAARVDPLAPGVKVAQKEVSRRTVWRRRATVGASVAGAAAVALIVATSVTQKHEDRSAEVPALQVRAPAVAGAPAAEVVQAAPPQASRPVSMPPASQGSGGDLPQRAVAAPEKKGDLPRQRKAEEPVRQKAAAAPLPSKDQIDLAPYGRNARKFDDGKAAQSPPPPPSAPQASRGAAADQLSSKPAPAASAARVREEQAPEKDSSERLAKAAPGPDLDPDRLEESAGTARRAGSYARAAELYKLASGLRRAKNDPSRAAWDLAHAVECLAAASKIHEAGDVRAELMRSYPAEEGPLRAANRALGWPAATPR
jgi:Putative zinc-finger